MPYNIIDGQKSSLKRNNEIGTFFLANSLFVIIYITNSYVKRLLGLVYQTFDGKDLYPSIEEKAANLLYFIVKNYSFVDGNKRIAATNRFANDTEKIVVDRIIGLW